MLRSVESPRKTVYSAKYRGCREYVDSSYALIADIIGSRNLTDRSAAQNLVLDVLARSATDLAVRETPYATVGDEFQAVARDVRSALALTLRAQLLLPDGIALRFGFGIGIGEVVDVAARGERRIEDGSAWSAARDAIVWAHEEQDKGRAFVRTRIRAGKEVDAVLDAQVATLNALVTLRDHDVFFLQAKQRRILGALLLGATQVEVARAEKRSQAAISEFVRGTGAGILRADALLADLELQMPMEPRTVAE